MSRLLRAAGSANLFTTLRCRPVGVSDSFSFQPSAESGLGIRQAIRSSVMATITRLKSLAGVRIPDTPLAKAAVDLLEVTSPQFICNHCVRTYVFGNLAVRRIGCSIIDEEIAFCGALLHDLGLVPAHTGANRFEVDGADAAREFCLKHQVAPERADRVWEAIALHTSAGIASRMAAEIALVHLGAALDFLGLGIDQVPPPVT